MKSVDIIAKQAVNFDNRSFSIISVFKEKGRLKNTAF